MKILIAGGGTGGHLFSGVAVAEELRARGHEVLFVGTARGIEAKVCPREGWRLELIDVGGLKGAGALGVVKGLFRVPRAIAQSRRIVKRERPDLVLGVGGYASGPVVLAAWMRGLPTAIIEQNSVPGFTNRVLGKLVRAVFGAFTTARGYFPSSKYHLVGNPIRARVRAVLERASAAAGAEARPIGLLVVGGSQGAHAVNELVCEAMALLKARGITPPLIHQTGEADRAPIAERYAKAGVSADVRAFIDDMGAAYRAARLVVARAGASTLAELTAIGLPSILIPFPHAADDHQTVNARELEAAGAARVAIQKETTPQALADLVASLWSDDEALAKMAAAARAQAHPDAHAAVTDAILALAQRAPIRLPESGASV
jgi:UDP-N-acetylglucosamine--N-acetylmuramyl-(pentapeptide) pyrophosphoryl-undecaprenol N-acetylglucosamine transferase